MKAIFTGSVSEGSFSRNCTMQYASCEVEKILENEVRIFLWRNHKETIFLERVNARCYRAFLNCIQFYTEMHRLQCANALKVLFLRNNRKHYKTTSVTKYMYRACTTKIRATQNSKYSHTTNDVKLLYSLKLCLFIYLYMGKIMETLAGWASIAKTC